MPKKKETIDHTQDFEFLLSSYAVTYVTHASDGFSSTYVSDNIKKITGYTPKDFINDPKFWRKHLHPDDVDRVYKGLDKLLKEDRYSHEYRFKCADGKYHWLRDELLLVRDKDGEPKEVIGYCVDVTKRKELEEELVESQKRLSLIYNTASDTMMLIKIVGDGTYVIESVNKAFLEVTKWKESDVAGKRVDEVLPQTTYETFVPKYQKVEKTCKPLRWEHESVTLSEKRYFTVDLLPVIEQGKCTYLLAVSRDITKQKEMEQAKNEFVSITSHELHTPLSMVNWYAELLLEHDAGPLTPKQTEYLEKITTAGRRMAELVEMFLNVAQLEMGTMPLRNEKLNIVNVTQDVLYELDQDIRRKEINVVCDYDEAIENSYGDKRMLRVLLLNIISNAIRYSQDKDVVTVHVKPVNKGEKYNRKTLKRDMFLITVKDEGYGIPKDVQKKIFDREFRAENVKKRMIEGTGLGLYIVKKIIQFVEGDVWFESKEKKGTTFHFTFPR